MYTEPTKYNFITPLKITFISRSNTTRTAAKGVCVWGGGGGQTMPLIHFPKGGGAWPVGSHL